MSTSTTQSIFHDITSIEDVARLLDTSVEQLRFLIYTRREAARYTTFTISKRSGGMRTIKAPRPELKAIQRRLADFLYDHAVVRPAAHGFARGKSIVTNAFLHVNHRTVLNVDLKDFFPTISFRRVRGLFISNPFGACPTVADILAQICCHEGTLPQGAPTSPVVSNMICARMDAQLLRLASDHRCVYTRYADDMTFSKRKGKLPTDLADVDEDGNIIVGKRLQEIIEQNGFVIHPDKVHLYRNTARQSVTGLTVNSGVNVPREFIRNIRAMICDWRTNGLEAAEKKHHEKFYRHPSRRRRKPSLDRIIEGKLNFLKMVRGVEDPVRRNLQRQFVGVWPEYQKIMDKEYKEFKDYKEPIMYDFFISHASEDKDDFVRPLADALRSRDIDVWYDEYMLTIGDDLYKKINEGLSLSRYGIVILSPSFFGIKKKWPDREVGAMLAMEDNDQNSRILPIWHNLEKADVVKHSPLLGDKFAWRSSDYTPEELAVKFADFIKTRRK